MGTFQWLKHEGLRPHHVNVEEDPENGCGILVLSWVSVLLSEPLSVSEVKNYRLYLCCTSRKLICQKENDSGLKEQLLMSGDKLKRSSIYVVKSQGRENLTRILETFPERF